jgi:hypothetical protein
MLLISAQSASSAIHRLPSAGFKIGRSLTAGGRRRKPAEKLALQADFIKNTQLLENSQ